MTQNRFYSSSYLPTTLASAITSNSSTSISVNSITGAPGSFPYTILVDWGTSTQEAMSVTASSGSGPYTLTVTRGIDGTTAQTHVNGAVVVHGVTAEDYNEPQVHISLATSGSSYPNVVHGLANGSSVVGTTDTQTLTNKTLGATSVTGAITSSVSSTAGGLVNVTNTHSAPTNGNVEITSAASTDKAADYFVSGDTVARYEVLASGKLNWGPGGATATDTDLYRSAAGVLSSDQTITATTGLQVGSATTGFGGGTGVLGITNASVAPNTTVTGGAVVYAQGGLLKSSTAAGLNQVITGSQPAATSTVTVASSTTETSLGSISVPANDVSAGCVYSFFLCGKLGTSTGPPVGTLQVRWGGTGGTSLVSLASGTNAPALTASISTTVPILIQGYVTFTSTTAATAMLEAYFNNSTSATTAPIVWLNVANTTGLTTTATEVLTVDWTWSASSAANTISIYTSSFERIS